VLFGFEYFLHDCFFGEGLELGQARGTGEGGQDFEVVFGRTGRS
jgi:hypothetical protein